MENNSNFFTKLIPQSHNSALADNINSAMKLFAILTFVSVFVTGFIIANGRNIGSREMTRQELNWYESRFKDGRSSHKPSFTFEEWKVWRERHGFVCNVDEDCSWLTIQKNMGCSEGEVRWAQDMGWAVPENLSAVSFQSTKQSFYLHV